MNDKHYTKAVIQTRAANQESDFVAVASTGVIDRHGESVSVEGWDLKAFKEDPVLLWAHDHYEMAVGQAKKVWIEGTGKKAKLMIEGFIHEYTEKSRALKFLVKEGIIKTMSVGFRPIDTDGDTYTKQELLEVSFVNVPANQQALITAYKSLKDAGFKEKTMNEIGIPVDVLDKLEVMEKDIQQLKATVKVSPATDPQIKKGTVLKERQAMLKVIARASDKLLEGEKKGLPRSNRTSLVKVIKRANEILIVANKGEIDGKN